HAAADALEEAKGDQLLNAVRLAAERRADHEDPHRREKGPLGAVAVGDEARAGDEDGEAEQVAGDGPLDGRKLGMEVERELRHGDVDRRAIQHVHEQAEDVDDRNEVLVLKPRKHWPSLNWGDRGSASEGPDLSTATACYPLACRREGSACECAPESRRAWRVGYRARSFAPRIPPRVRLSR